MNLKRFFLLSLLVLAAACSSGSDTPEEPNDFELSAIEKEVLSLINKHRKEIGKNELSHSNIAYKEALKHTEYMIANETISHDNFNDRSGNIIVEAKASSVSENVARFYENAEEVFQAWIHSTQGHRENIEGDFTHTAVCARKDNEGRYYFTEMFYK